MRGDEFLDRLELVDSAFIEAAEQAGGKKNKHWKIWGAAAACLCLVAVGTIVLLRGSRPDPGAEESASVSSAEEEARNDTAAVDYSAEVAYGFRLEENALLVFSPISFEDRIRFGILPPDAVGLSAENTYRITEADLGEVIGTVTVCEDPAMLGCTVYRFASFPEYDAICIVDAPGGYAFYTGSYEIPEESLENSDAILELYELPDSLVSMEILMPSWRSLGFVEDANTQDAILTLLAGKRNIGLAESNHRFYDAWIEVYGEEGVVFDENDHVARFTDSALMDKAAELWSEGSRLLRLTTDKGFCIVIDFSPAVRELIWHGYYVLGEEEAEALSALMRNYVPNETEPGPEPDVESALPDQSAALTAYQNMLEAYGVMQPDPDVMPAFYGGCYVDNDAGEVSVLTICLTEITERTMEEFYLSCGTDGIAFREVEYSYRELHAAMQALTDYNSSRETPLCFSWGIDEMRNCIPIEVLPEQEAEAAAFCEQFPCVKYTVAEQTVSILME